MQTLREEVEASLWQERLLAALSIIFGGIAALLASIGLYGALDYAVKSRTREIGLRMALGAQPARIVSLLSHETLLLVAGGAALGLCAHAAAAVWIRRVLYDVRSWEPLAVGSVLLLIGLVAAIAAASGCISGGPDRSGIGSAGGIGIVAGLCFLWHYSSRQELIMFRYVVTGNQVFGTIDLNTGVLNLTGTQAVRVSGLGEIGSSLYATWGQRRRYFPVNPFGKFRLFLGSRRYQPPPLRNREPYPGCCSVSWLAGFGFKSACPINLRKAEHH